MKLRDLGLLALVCGLVTGACMKNEPIVLSFYDWVSLGTKAPSVLPEVKYDTKLFHVEKIERVKPFPSPPVLAPYNVSMDFDTIVHGTLDGKPAVVQTHT